MMGKSNFRRFTAIDYTNYKTSIFISPEGERIEVQDHHSWIQQNAGMLAEKYGLDEKELSIKSYDRRKILFPVLKVGFIRTQDGGNQISMQFWNLETSKDNIENFLIAQDKQKYVTLVETPTLKAWEFRIEEFMESETHLMNYLRKYVQPVQYASPEYLASFNIKADKGDNIFDFLYRNPGASYNDILEYLKKMEVYKDLTKDEFNLTLADMIQGGSIIAKKEDGKAEYYISNNFSPTFIPKELKKVLSSLKTITSKQLEVLAFDFGISEEVTKEIIQKLGAPVIEPPIPWSGKQYPKSNEPRKQMQVEKKNPGIEETSLIEQNDTVLPLSVGG